MKKFLSAFLAILMVLSMVATSMVTVFAADAEEVHSILISNGEDIAADQNTDGGTSEGWRSHKINLSLMEIDGHKAAGQKVVGPKALTDARFHYYTATTVDTTKWTHVEFDLYVEDAAKLPEGFSLNIELCSGGRQDVDEIDTSVKTLVSGWNHIKIALADIAGKTGNFDPTKWNFTRIYFSTGNFNQAADAELILAIDNFGFSDGTEAPAEKAEPLPTPVVTPTEKGLKEIVLSNNAAEDFYNIAKPGWAVGGGGQAYGNGWAEVELDGKTGIATTLTGSGNVVTSRFHYYAVEPTDISGMTHFELDLYISDASVVNGKQFIIEIQDLGLWGAGAQSEIRYINNNAQFKNGWNHIKLSLDDDFKDRLGEGCPVLDRTVWQHCRVWFPDAAYTDANITYALGGLKFTNASYDAQEVAVPGIDSLKPEGWNWEADITNKAKGNASVYTTLKANQSYGGGAGAFLACYEPKDVTYDVSEAKTFRFYLYTDDAAVMKTVQVELELTSGGTCDDHECAYVGTLEQFVDGGIKNGWNEVNIPLTSLDRKSGDGGADWTKLNFFRMYNSGGFTTGDVAMTIALDELAFYAEDGTTRVARMTKCDVATKWDASAAPIAIDDEIVIGATWAAGAKLGVGAFMLRYGEGGKAAAMDVSGMKYLEFDFYVSDAAAMNAAGFSFELTSAGQSDKEESAFNWDGNFKTGLANGWNHVQLPLSWFNTTNGTIDWTAVNFIRWFNSKDLQVGDNGLTVAIKNVEFTTGKYALEIGENGLPLTEKEVITFTPAKGDKDDAANSANKDYIVKITSGANDEKFYADGNGEVTYKIPVSAAKYVKYVTVSMTTGSQLLLEASTDGENWTTVYQYKNSHLEANPATSGGLEKGLYTFDLTDAVVGEKGLTGDYIYIRIKDSYPQSGWGGNLYYTPITFEIIRNCVPHEIKLPAYGTDLEGWNWSSSLNHAEGSFSASNTFGAGQTLGNANILVLFQSKDGEGVDASAADTFEFDLYVSNAAALKDMNVELELTSGGRPDDHEKRYVNATLSALIEGGMKDGWNHVVLPLSKMGDHDANQPIDWTNVNCFRQYFFAGVNTGDADLVVAYDNLIFTKGGEKVATLSNAEPNTNGWEGPAMDMNGQLVIGKEITGNAFGVCDIYINYIGEKGIDVSGLKYLEYDIYVSDVEALKDVTLYTEINSSGDYDKNELGYDKTFAAHGLKNGWNRIKIELAKMGDTAGNGACDLTDIKWFRIFTVAEATLTDGLTYAITNVRFTDDKAPEVALPENPTIDTPAGPPAADSELSIKDAIALGGSMEHNTYTEGKYYVTGVITEVYNTQYGNMKITDDKGNILTIYGTYSADGATRYDKLETKPVVGDTVTIYGIVGQYNGTPQIKNGWITEHIATPETNTKEDLYEFFIDNGAKEAPYLDPDYKANWNGSLRFADASQYFIYKFKLTAFRGVESITFAGNFGGQYHIWASADGKTWIEIAKRAETSPAQSLTLNLSELADDVANTMTLYVKIGDSDTSNGNGGNMNGNVQLKVVYDKDADQTEIIPTEKVEQEKISFRIETDEEKAYLIENDAPINDTLRYADAGKHFTYKYTIKNVHQVKSVIWKAKTSQQFKLDISFDNENWVNVFSTTEKLAQQVREYDLTEFLVDENGTIANATFYLKISDADPADGWGGGVNRDVDVTLLVDYVALTDEQKDAIEATVTEHCIPLWGANKTWGDIYVTDNDNQVSGSGCVSANLKGVSGTHAPSKQFESVDATGMDTFEFYVYLSDLAIVDHLKNNTGSGSVELCSGGACDQGEKAVSLNQIFTDFVVGELTTGWNEIAIPLNKMAGTPGAYGNFELNNINYIRIFWSGMSNPTDQEWIIKFDNFRMTDRQAAEAKAYEEFVISVLEANKGLIANLEDLKSIYEGEITADNYKSASAKYSAAKSAFDKLDEASQNVLKEKGYYVHISKAKKAIEDYEEAQQILKDNAQLIADLEALVAYKDASAFTFDNYDAAKAAIEAARAAVDALTKSVKDALATYIAHLTAAEAALPAEKPACTDHVDADKNGKCDKCDADVEVDDNTGDNTGDDTTDGGCKSALTIGAVATMILAGAWVTIAARKKED